MKLQKELGELINAGIIDQQTAQAIVNYYSKDSASRQSSFMSIFGIIGATLVGLGLLLIIGHNWDSFSTTIKTIIAFAPVILAQAIVYFTITKKRSATSWKEGSGIFLTFTIGTCIALISQIFHLGGSIQGFLWLWICLSIGIVYILEAQLLALLIIVASTVFLGHTGYQYESYIDNESYWYWIFIVAILPFYWKLLKQENFNLGTIALNFAIPSSITYALGSFHHKNEVVLLIAFILLFAIWYCIGYLKKFKCLSKINNGYLILGSVGSFIVLIIASFNEFWVEISESNLGVFDIEWIISLVLGLCYTFILFYLLKKEQISVVPMMTLPLVFIPIFLLPFSPFLKTLIVNIIILSLAISTIRIGVMRNHLGVLNYGLLVITVLIICRFFDTNISFILRGISFVLIGIGFFISNYLMMKNRSHVEKV